MNLKERIRMIFRGYADATEHLTDRSKPMYPRSPCKECEHWPKEYTVPGCGSKCPEDDMYMEGYRSGIKDTCRKTLREARK